MSSLCRGLLRVRHPDNQIYSRDSQYGYKRENELAFGYHACFYFGDSSFNVSNIFPVFFSCLFQLI